MRKLLFTLLILILATVGLVAQNLPPVPNPPRLVNDYTKTLTSAQTNNLERKLVAFNDSTSNQIAVVIIPSLDGYDIADYAFQLGDKWGIGQKSKRNGVLLLVSKGDREVFIAVGYGLEGAIPDIMAKKIVSQVITPRFKAGDFYGGIDEATNALMQLSAGEYKPGKGDVMSKTQEEGTAIGALIFMVILLFLIFKYPKSMGGLLMLLLAMGSNNRRGGGRGGGNFGGFGGGSFGGGGAGGKW